MAGILNSAILEFRHCHLGYSHTLVIFFQTHSKTLCQDLVPTHLHKKIQSDSNSFILTQVDDGSHLELCHVGFRHCHLGFRHLSYLLSDLLKLANTGSHHLHKKKHHSFILTQIDDGSHLDFCHVGFRHCHLGFRYLVIFSQIHSKTLSLYSDSDSN